MKYFVLYDLNDNIVVYLDNINELSNFTGLRIKDINYKFAISLFDFIFVVIDNIKYKVFKFN